MSVIKWNNVNEISGRGALIAGQGAQQLASSFKGFANTLTQQDANRDEQGLRDLLMAQNEQRGINAAAFANGDDSARPLDYKDRLQALHNEGNRLGASAQQIAAAEQSLKGDFTRQNTLSSQAQSQLNSEEALLQTSYNNEQKIAQLNQAEAEARLPVDDMWTEQQESVTATDALDKYLPQSTQKAELSQIIAEGKYDGYVAEQALQSMNIEDDWGGFFGSNRSIDTDWNQNTMEEFRKKLNLYQGKRDNSLKSRGALLNSKENFIRQQSNAELNFKSLMSQARKNVNARNGVFN